MSAPHDAQFVGGGLCVDEPRARPSRSQARDYHRAPTALEPTDGDVLAELVAAQARAAAEIDRLGGWDRMHEAEALLEHVFAARVDRRHVLRRLGVEGVPTSI